MTQYAITQWHITQVVNYSITQIMHYWSSQLLKCAITQLLNYSITQLLNYSINQLLSYSIIQLINCSITHILNSQLLHDSISQSLKYSINSPGLGPAGVSDHQHWVLVSALSIFSNCFRNFCNRSQLKQPFSSNFPISNFNQLKLWHEFEPQFELELKSSLNSSSSYCFCWEVRTRGGVSGSHRTRG